MIKNIIFDFDGTIGDSTALIVQCFQDTLSELNLRVCTAQECRETIGLPLRAAFVQLAGATISLVLFRLSSMLSIQFTSWHVVKYK